MPSLRPVVVAVVACVLLAVAAAEPALAHVTVDPAETPAGGFTVLTFKVPNEEADAATSKIEVQMPTDPPLASVSLRPNGDWKATVVTAPLATPVTDDDGNQITEAVSTVTWEGGRIEPGQFEEFEMSVGPLAGAAGTTLSFPAVQTYDNGDVVRWIDPTVAGQPRPEHPAPSVLLTADAGDAVASSTGGDSSDGTGRALGIVGIVLGAAGVVLGGLALASSRRAR
jgi:uncharacterized protein